MSPASIWGLAAALAAWIALMAFRGGPTGAAVALHWPVTLVLLFGYAFDLRGGLLAAAGATALAAGLRAAGLIDTWTLVGWQALVYGIFGLYPFKFLQVREQRQHHYRTLIEYKRGELDALKAKVADVDKRCRELEQRGRNGGAG